MRTYQIISLLMFSVAAIGQSAPENNDRPSNNISLNLMEGGTLASITFEHYFLNKPNYLLAFQIGAGVGIEGDFFSFSKEKPENVYLFNIPYHLSFCLGGARHYLETGIGSTIINVDIFGSPLIYPIVGYRFQEFGGYNTSFRLFIQLPVVKPTDRDILFVIFGISLGKNF